MIDKRPIYFNEGKHEYTNEFGDKFISVTTLLGNYEEKFDDNKVKIARACERIGRNPRHPKYNKYKGKTWKGLIKEWQAKADKACDIGNTKHNYLEKGVKSSSGFNSVFTSRYANIDTVRLYTIEDILNDHNYGSLNLSYFVKYGIKDKYPKIYNLIEKFVNDGWKIYSEIGVFDFELLVSGLVDILFVKDNKFVILDWKTNKNPIRFESGYWDNDKNGNAQGYITTDKMFKYPINKMSDSNGNKYTLQLSMYARLIEGFGLQYVALILCQILHDSYKIGDDDIEDHPEWIDKNKVVILPIEYKRGAIVSILGDHELNRNKGLTYV